MDLSKNGLHGALESIRSQLEQAHKNLQIFKLGTIMYLPEDTKGHKALLKEIVSLKNKITAELVFYDEFQELRERHKIVEETV